MEKFTNVEGDYLKKDILNTIQKLYGYDDNIKKLKKGELFSILVGQFLNLDKYNDKNDIQKIITIQKLYRTKKNKLLDNLRGEGFNDKKKCMNETDFFTYETYDEIKDRYFFSYKDEKDFIWFFDIRSFKKLMEMDQPNPYTMRNIPIDTINNAKYLLTKLKLGESDEIEDKKKVILTRKQIMKQKTTDLFSEITQCGYDCQPEWFLSLNIRLLKKLYQKLEDIWNYRLQLTPEMKSRICPPNGLVYNVSINEVNGIQSTYSVQEIILNETLKFNNAVNIEDRKLGYIYFLIGLGQVSIQCYTSHQWLMNI
tara:strand:+ start:292 stop:1224 length:933 start_codon:yes stop_codon:yes gene_type:complete